MCEEFEKEKEKGQKFIRIAQKVSNLFILVHEMTEFPNEIVDYRLQCIYNIHYITACDYECEHAM